MSVVRRRPTARSPELLHDLLQLHVSSYGRWMDKASILEEQGRPEHGVTWRSMAEGKASEILEILDEAERDGIVLPQDVPTVGSVPTRFKLREEIERLQGRLKEAEFQASANCGLRLQMEEAILRWQLAAAALVAVAVVGWIL